ncbi:phosphoadenosine phosphosulfate reductase family protein, partial [Candidatus Roizmanbacteria bacterium]|nr:phosphoadenosine phosphosulfate reductase family protein [Candidatus Roizmanbacteria bacterium]
MILDRIKTRRYLQKSYDILSAAYKKFAPRSMAVAWTGGKDSTLLLWLVRTYSLKHSIAIPKIIFIDEGDIFLQVRHFVRRLTKDWSLDIDVVQNTDVLRQGSRIGEVVQVAKLSKENQKELKRLGVKVKSFPFEPESYIGNHLMKTVALNSYLVKHNIAAVFTGIRWDEHEARSNETYFSSRQNPDHTRVHPILHFSESDVWRTIQIFKIPFV